MGEPKLRVPIPQGHAGRWREVERCHQIVEGCCRGKVEDCRIAGQHAACKEMYRLTAEGKPLATLHPFSMLWTPVADTRGARLHSTLFSHVVGVERVGTELDEGDSK